MPRISPTLEGFRAAFRRPSLTFAEIAWRWTVGAVAWTLFIFSFIEYLNTLPVTRGDKALLGTRQPLLIGKAISHIFHGSLNRAVFAVFLAAGALVVLWIIAASAGRIATVRALLEYFERDVASNGATEAASTLPIFRPLFALNFLRAAVALGAILALVGAAILAGFASPDKNPRPGLAFILFLPCAALICMAWPALNWLLSLASIFAIRDGEDALGALSGAVTLCREHMGAVFAVGAWTGMAHLVALSIAGTAVSLPMAFVQVAPGRLVLAVIILIALAYFAVVDWLYMARLAGYVCIAEMPEASAASLPLPTPPFSSQTLSPQTAIDRDEPILSDLPNLAVET
jgi:hypothetical protein